MPTALKIVTLVLAIVTLASSVERSQFHTITVGVIYGPSEDSRLDSRKLWSMGLGSNLNLEPAVERVAEWGSVQITRAICSLLKAGVNVLVSTAPPRYHPLLQSYSSKFMLPLITTAGRGLSREGKGLSMTPNTAETISDIIKEYHWTSFVYLYDNDDGFEFLESVLAATGPQVVVEATWRVTNGEEALRFLKQVRGNQKQILADIDEKKLQDIISSGAVDNHYFILSKPVISSDMVSGQSPAGYTLVTQLSLKTIDGNQKYMELLNRWNTLTTQISPIRNGKAIPDSALMIYDVANVLDQGFRRLLIDSPGLDLTPRGVNCLSEDYTNDKRIINAIDHHLKKVAIESGMTGRIQFTQNGSRQDISYNITLLSSSGPETIGTWSPNSKLHVTLTKPPEEPKPVKLQRVTVTAIMGDSLLRFRNGENVNSTRPEKFDGYVIDLLDVLSETLGWTYHLELAEDGIVGDQLPNGSWTGMAGKLLRQEADMAIMVMDPNSLLSRDLDASKPFLTSGLTILKLKSRRFTSGISPLSILSVWSYDTWLIFALLYGVVSVSHYVASRFAGEPDRIRSLDTKLSDRLSICSSFWFAFGSLTLRGTGIYPRSLTQRLLSIIWWTFGLLVFICYVSSVTSMLLKNRSRTDRVIHPTKSIDFLQNFIDAGHPKIGLWKGETHFKFAEVGLFKAYSELLKNSGGDLYVDSYEEGVTRVRKSLGDFAFVVNSVFGHYTSSGMPCDTSVTSGYLVHQPYVFAFRKGSPFKKPIEAVLLDLTSSGDLRRLYEKWWYHQSSCIDPNLDILPSLYTTSLNLYEVSVVFYILIIFTLIAILVAAYEYYLQSKRIVVDN